MDGGTVSGVHSEAKLLEFKSQFFQLHACLGFTYVEWAVVEAVHIKHLVQRPVQSALISWTGL